MLTVVFLLLGIAAATRAQSLNATTCADVQIFIAVGHGENFPGNQLSIAQAVCKGRSSCAYSNINFASTSSASYCTVAVQGINSGVATLAAYAQKCPKSKIVVSGWSQVSSTRPCLRIIHQSNFFSHLLTWNMSQRGRRS